MTSEDDDSLWQTINQLAETIGLLAEKLGENSSGLEDLAGRVEAFETASPARSAGDGTAAVMPLEQWVHEWLIPTYHLSEPLQDWTRNPALVAELQTLELAYRAVDPASPTFDGVAWHSHLHSMLDRVAVHQRRYSAETGPSVLNALAEPRQESPPNLPFGQIQNPPAE